MNDRIEFSTDDIRTVFASLGWIDALAFEFSHAALDLVHKRDAHEQKMETDAQLKEWMSHTDSDFFTKALFKFMQQALGADDLALKMAAIDAANAFVPKKAAGEPLVSEIPF